MLKSDNAQNLKNAISKYQINKRTGDTTFFYPSTIDNEKKNTLFIFVGEKIEVNKLPQDERSMDNGFLAKYKVLDKFYGNYLKDTIEFKAFDHYGDPSFSNHKYVLLFLSFANGQFYHEKYQYFDLYKTKNDKWASSYSVEDYTHEYNKETEIKPEKIEFSKDVYYKLNRKDKAFLDIWYPVPYYQIEKDSAKAIYGNYIPELFKLKRNGVLKARELF
jgi:hypothetical protein